MHLVAAHTTIKSAVVESPILAVDRPVLTSCNVQMVKGTFTVVAEASSSEIGFFEGLAALAAELEKMLQPARIVLAAKIP